MGQGLKIITLSKDKKHEVEELKRVHTEAFRPTGFFSNYLNENELQEKKNEFTDLSCGFVVDYGLRAGGIVEVTDDLSGGIVYFENYKEKSLIGDILDLNFFRAGGLRIFFNACRHGYGYAPSNFMETQDLLRKEKKFLSKQNIIEYPVTYIMQIGVVPEHQGKGIGSFLMSRVFDNSKGPYLLETFKKNLLFFKKLGFEEVGKPINEGKKTELRILLRD